MQCKLYFDAHFYYVNFMTLKKSCFRKFCESWLNLKKPVSVLLPTCSHTTTSLSHLHTQPVVGTSLMPNTDSSYKQLVYSVNILYASVYQSRLCCVYYEAWRCLSHWRGLLWACHDRICALEPKLVLGYCGYGNVGDNTKFPKHVPRKTSESHKGHLKPRRLC